MAGIYYTLAGSTALARFPGVVLSVAWEFASEMSPHPVEDATTVTDHATIQPDHCTLEVRVSPVVLSGTAGDPSAAMALIERLRAERVLCSISSDVRTGESMGLVHVGAPRTLAEGSMLALTLEFQEVRVVTTQEVGAPALAPTRRRTQAGASTATTPDPAQSESLAHAGIHAVAARVRAFLGAAGGGA